MNNNIKLRTIEQKDNVELAIIIRNALKEFNADRPGTVYYDPTTDDLFSLFQIPGSAYFILEENGVMLGGAGVYPTNNLPEGVCELVKIYLTPESRGKGYGKLLMEKCFEAGKAMGYQSIYLETMPELRTAVPLYEKMGFEYLPNPLGNSGHHACDLWMLRSL